MLRSVNWAGVGVAAVASYLIGFVWYGLLFEAVWLELNGLTAAEAAEGGNLPMVLGFLNTVAVAVGLGLIVPRLGAGWAGGARTGLIAGLFFACTTAAMGFIYGKAPLGLAPLDLGYLLITYLVSGALVGGLSLGRRGG